MSKSASPSFQRDYAAVLSSRLGEPRRFLQVLAGPRQVGKTTLVQQVLARIRRPSVYVSADEPALRDPAWLPGLAAFGAAFKPKRSLLVGGDGIPVEEFLSRPVTDWLQR